MGRIGPLLHHADLTELAFFCSLVASLGQFNPVVMICKVGLSGTNPSEVTITRSVLASLREYPGYVEALLAQTPSTNEAGKYCVHLFDMWQRRWRYIGVTRSYRAVEVTNLFGCSLRFVALEN